LLGLPGVVSAEASSSDGETRARVECAEGSEVSEEIFQLAVSRGWVLRELTREALSLEDVFVRLTRHDSASASSSAEATEDRSAEATADTRAEPAEDKSAEALAKAEADAKADA